MILAKKIFFCFLLLICSVACPNFAQAETGSIDLSTPMLHQNKKGSICLTMIVRNEARIIERCLNSVKDIADCISICDTGSTDNTVEIIEQFMKKHHIPGTVHHHVWKNFGHNRTLSIQAAQKTLNSLGFPLQHTFLLLLDADMKLEIEPEFTKNALTFDCYLVLQRSSALSYYNTRLVRASLPWESVGVTHEYLSSKFPHQRQQLNTLIIDDQEDGGCKSDKFERDIRLLTQGLKDEPENERYMFYFAQSHKCLSQFDDAIKWYQHRIAKGGWKEEVWYSMYMIGECYEALEQWDDALHWYLEAYQYNPERSETLHKIARHYRIQGQNELSYLFAKQGERVPYPKNQILFIAHPVYDYLFDEELSIASCYTRFKDEGFSAANRLVLKKSVPNYIRDQSYRNMLFYVKNLKNAKFQPITIELPLLHEGSTERYHGSTPSIQKTENGYALICRTVNYSQVKGHDYKSRDPLDSTIRTRNFLVNYDRDFHQLSQQEILENVPRERVHTQVQGLEDCRLFALNNSFWMFCVTYDSPHTRIGQTLCKLAHTPSSKTVEVEKFIPLIAPKKRECEKNWLPFIKDGELHAIYSFEPFILLKPDLTTGICQEVLHDEPKYNFSSFRGSAAPIAFDEGYLALVHEVVFTDQRSYMHRFVYFNKDFVVTKLSRPFTFQHIGIEYCCGMTTDHSEKNLLITFSLEDREAQLCTVDLDTVKSLLEPLPPL